MGFCANTSDTSPFDHRRRHGHGHGHTHARAHANVHILTAHSSRKTSTEQSMNEKKRNFFRHSKSETMSTRIIQPQVVAEVFSTRFFPLHPHHTQPTHPSPPVHRVSLTCVSLLAPIVSRILSVVVVFRISDRVGDRDRASGEHSLCAQCERAAAR